MTVSKITSAPTPNETIGKINEIIDNLGGGGITVDSTLSTTSENPVQNKVITTALNNKQGVISDLATIRSGASAGATAVQPDDLATVATSGNYNDLINKPTIPAAQVNSDWNATSGKAQILNKPSLSTVATSGSYNDLSNKPTIPTVNNATLTIQKNGTTVKTFTANSSSNVTANITVPTKTSELTNDSGYTSNVGTVTSVNNVSPVNGNVSLSIPTVNNGTLTIQKNGTTVKTFTANSSSNVTANITVPTDTNDLTNGAGYITGITSSEVTNALGYTPTSPANVDGQWVASTQSLTVSASKTTSPQEFNLKTLNYLPNDNNKYEVLVWLEASAGTGSASVVYLSSDIVSGNGIAVQKSESKYGDMNLSIPVTSTLKVQVTLANVGSITLSVLGYRRIGTNS